MLFFLFPIFILLVCWGITHDLESSNALEIGLSLAGISSCIYFLGALLLGAFKLFFNVKNAPYSFFVAAFTSLINALITFFAVFSIENLCLKEYLEQKGPVAILKIHFFLLFIVYLIVQLFETIAISISEQSKVVSEEKKLSKNLFFISSLYILIPITYVFITASAYFFTSNPDRIAFWSDTLMTLSSKEKAGKYIDSGLETYPDDAKLCYLKANLLAGSESYIHYQNSKAESEALKFAQIATKEKPNSPIYKYYYSYLLEINDSYEKAIQVAEEAAELAKNDIFLWQNLGDLNQKHSRYTESINAYKKALEIDSENATVLNNLSYALLNCDKDLPTALELAEKSVKISPNSVANVDTLAWAYYKNKQFTNALETINLLYVDRKSRSPEIDFHYIAILDSMGLLKNSLEDYDKMLVKPEVVANKDLVLQINEARQKAEEKLKGLSKRTDEK